MRERRFGWLVWRLETPPGRDKPTKVPYDPVSGRKADVMRSAGATFEVACEALLNGGGYNGVGFALTEDGNITLIDLDDPEGDTAKAAYQQPCSTVSRPTRSAHPLVSASISS